MGLRSWAFAFLHVGQKAYGRNNPKDKTQIKDRSPKAKDQSPKSPLDNLESSQFNSLLRSYIALTLIFDVSQFGFCVEHTKVRPRLDLAE